MVYKTIDTHEAIGLFDDLMQPNSQTRILRLLGDSKLGKSHLLTKVFPMLAQQNSRARCVILDLQSHFISEVPDILHAICGMLGGNSCDSYYASHQAWTNRPKVDIDHLNAVFSSVTISVKEPTLHEIRQRDRDLTTQFVRDMSRLTDVLLLFDSVDRATEYIQNWLMYSLLIQLSSLAHVRVVVAGRSLPEAHGSYLALCRSYRLVPVTDVVEYIAYCRSLQATLSEQSIRDFAKAFDYTPGVFVDFVLPHFVPRSAHG
jgi:hypothetical protein